MSDRIKLLDGNAIPRLALGTFKDRSERIQNAVRRAIQLGYRHIDTAYVYENEWQVGKAIKESGVDRGQLFVTDKLACIHQNRVSDALDDQLELTGLSYFDLYLVHWPMAFDPTKKEAIPVDEDGNVIPFDKDYVETWKEMRECQSSGRVKSIGVSNFNQKQLQRIYDECGKQWPVVNQIEVNPYCPEWELIKFCQDRGIVVEAYAPLGAGDRMWGKPSDPVLLQDPTLTGICKKLNAEGSYKEWDVAKLIIRWLIQRNLVAIVKTVNEDRLISNLAATKLPDLPQWALDEIAAIKKRFRHYQIPSFLSHPNYPYEIWEQ